MKTVHGRLRPPAANSKTANFLKWAVILLLAFGCRQDGNELDPEPLLDSSASQDDSSLPGRSELPEVNEPWGQTEVDIKKVDNIEKGLGGEEP